MKISLSGIFFHFCYTITIMGILRKKRKSFLERAEAVVLEHIPDKYQKSLVGVYRLGFFMNAVGIFGMILSLFSILGIFVAKDNFTTDGLIMRVVLLAIMTGLAILGGLYMKMKLNPPLAFGWAVFIGIICLILTGFFGFVLVAMFVNSLEEIYGPAMLCIVGVIMFLLTVLPLLILLNAIYYLFFAHKEYAKWYQYYAKRHHLGEEVKVVKKTSKKNNQKLPDEYVDDGL